MARTSRRVLSERTVSVGSRRAATMRLGSSRRRGVLISIRAMSTAVERNLPLSSTTRYFSHAPQTTSSHGSPSQRNCHSKPAAQWQTCLAFACPSEAQRSQPTCQFEVLSSSALWTWLVPVIWGWIAVGTQSTSNTIDGTLSEFTLLRAGQQDAPPHRTSNQEGFRVIKHHPNERLPKFLIFGICGDEIQQGPTFNYARVFTWWHAAKTTPPFRPSTRSDRSCRRQRLHFHPNRKERPPPRDTAQ
ncbi:hypothetical protein B0T17DRAFT_162766 [Bombardia bombarda]|uniref:Uncharacterized protein n=1 Tax=Bombardia bombarda TaxID=252184 RepID=A0AA40C907_9PEZI|nr:hypothetical protein B0T17DRAFT_162766 [Bombardia bombarda]